MFKKILVSLALTAGLLVPTTSANAEVQPDTAFSCVWRAIKPEYRYIGGSDTQGVLGWGQQDSCTIKPHNETQWVDLYVYREGIWVKAASRNNFTINPGSAGIFIVPSHKSPCAPGKPLETWRVFADLTVVANDLSTRHYSGYSPSSNIYC